MSDIVGHVGYSPDFRSKPRKYDLGTTRPRRPDRPQEAEQILAKLRLLRRTPDKHVGSEHHMEVGWDDALCWVLEEVFGIDPDAPEQGEGGPGEGA